MDPITSQPTHSHHHHHHHPQEPPPQQMMLMGPSAEQVANMAVCPPGMEYLMGTNMILVRQLVELLEVFTGFDTNNRYEILDMAGRRMYFAAEQTDCCTRLLCGSRRPFEITVLNNMGGICLKIKRPMTCAYCCCPGCFNKVQFYTGSEVFIGEVTQDCCDCCCPRYTVKDDQGNAKLKIKGPCSCCMCCNVVFKVTDLDDQEVGEIHKKWGGIVKEAFTTADTFGVTFPLDLDPRLKCLLLGAVFLIDFMYFEHKTDHNDAPGVQVGGSGIHFGS